MKYDNIDKTKELMTKVKHIMIDKGIKQTDLKKNMNVSKQTISNLLNAKQLNLTLDTLVQLCSGLECDLYIDIVPKDNEIE